MRRPSSVSPQRANCLTLASSIWQARNPASFRSTASASVAISACGADRLLIGGRVIEPLAVVTRNAGRRHIGKAGQIESNRPVQDAADCRAVALRGGGSDPLEHPVERVGVGKNVVRSLPVVVFVGVAEACDPKRRALSERPAEVRRGGAREHCRLESVNDIR
jgi:hypothetical protein